MSLSRKDLVNYFVLAAVDIREREEELLRIHAKAVSGVPLSPEDIGFMFSQQLHTMRHTSNALIMLGRYFEQYEGERGRGLLRRLVTAAFRKRL